MTRAHQVTEDQFRTIALALPGADERQHMGHPDFRVGGRIFASLLTVDHEFELDHAMVKLTPEQQRRLLKSHPAVFTPAAGAWGRRGCTLIRLAAAKAPAVREAMGLAWHNTAPASLAATSKLRSRARLANERPKGDQPVSFKQRPGQKRKKMSGGGHKPAAPEATPAEHVAPPHEPDSPDHNTGKAGRIHEPDKSMPAAGPAGVPRKGGASAPRLGPRTRGGKGSSGKR